MDISVDEEILRNAPKERRAQIMAKKIIKKFFGFPEFVDKKIKLDILDACRRKVGAFTAR